MLLRTERQIVGSDPKIDDLCFRSKNLYNYANYLIRQEFINNGRWLRYSKLDKILQSHESYLALPAVSAQQQLILLDKNWKSFFKAIKVWKKNPSKFTGRPSLPKYKHKVKGRSITVFTSKQAKIKDGYIRFPDKANIGPVKTNLDKLRQVRIIPQATCYVIEVVYEKKELTKEEKDKLELDPNRILSGDMGTNNLAAFANNIGLLPFIINGRILKSINQFYNKKQARLQKLLGSSAKTSKKIKALALKRNNKILDYLHKASKYIIDYCIANKIGTLVLGYNPGWKQEIEMGKRNNQNFVMIPFLKFLELVRYKGAEFGIDVRLREESYTSKCSFLDNEEICYHEKYAGRRIKRGLFKTATGKLLNADINGALNILVKEFPNAFQLPGSHGIEGLRLNPCKVSLAC